MLAQRVDAVICTAGRQSDRVRLKRLAKETPTVLAVRNWPNSAVTSVSHDDAKGGRLAAEHLLSLGHTKLAQLMGPQDIGSFEDRTRGFLHAASDAGVECQLIDRAVHLPTLDAGRQLMDALLHRAGADRPTGIFAQNDTMAIGALHLATERGVRCPDDISIVGYNDVPLTAYLTPALTTIKLPGYEVGRLAAEMAASLIEDRSQSPSAVTLAPELIVRQSTRAV